jgi:protease I
MNELQHKRVAVFASDGVEKSELTEPIKALKEAGAEVEIISPTREPIQAFEHHSPSSKIPVDRSIDEASAEEFDALVLPGGALNADSTRIDPKVQTFVRHFGEEHKPMAVICHAPWLLASTGMARGRKMTSWPTIQDDLRNAGAQWVDEEVVVDDNLVTSRGPKDLPAFNRSMVELFGR